MTWKAASGLGIRYSTPCPVLPAALLWGRRFEVKGEQIPTSQDQGQNTETDPTEGREVSWYT